MARGRKFVPPTVAVVLLPLHLRFECTSVYYLVSTEAPFFFYEFPLGTLSFIWHICNAKQMICILSFIDNGSLRGLSSESCCSSFNTIFHLFRPIFGFYHYAITLLDTVRAWGKRGGSIGLIQSHQRRADGANVKVLSRVVRRHCRITKWLWRCRGQIQRGGLCGLYTVLPRSSCISSKFQLCIRTGLMIFFYLKKYSKMILYGYKQHLTVGHNAFSILYHFELFGMACDPWPLRRNFTFSRGQCDLWHGQITANLDFGWACSGLNFGSFSATEMDSHVQNSY